MSLPEREAALDAAFAARPSELPAIRNAVAEIARAAPAGRRSCGSASR